MTNDFLYIHRKSKFGASSGTAEILGSYLCSNPRRIHLTYAVALLILTYITIITLYSLEHNQIYQRRRLENSRTFIESL